MNYKIHQVGGRDAAELDQQVVIGNGQDFLDVAMNLPCDSIIIHQESLTPDFFELRSGVAGEILQKVVNYRLRLMVVGDFSVYESQSLRNFIYESNQSTSIGFVDTVEEALERLVR